MTEKLRLGVLASGSGTNLQAIIDRCQDGSLAAQIAVVITNNPGAGALERAAQAGIATCCVNHRDFGRREDFDAAVVQALQEADVELVVLAGFMRIITETFIQAFPERIINIHLVQASAAQNPLVGQLHPHSGPAASLPGPQCPAAGDRLRCTFFRLHRAFRRWRC
ncbi:MAG: formyltransferase family protein [Desulfuromonadales bacterium]